MASKPRLGHGGGGKGAVFSQGGRSMQGSSNSKHKALGGAAVSRSITAAMKGKAASSSSSKTVTRTTTVKAKSQKKVYSLPGQKFDVPEEREPLRIFYESLSKQIPSSEMAEFWLMEHGMLSPERAKRAYERKQRRQQQIRTGIPIQPTKPARTESYKKQQAVKNGDIKTKKRVDYGDDDNDFIVKLKKTKQ